jgi:hypothetical protein
VLELATECETSLVQDGLIELGSTAGTTPYPDPPKVSVSALKGGSSRMIRKRNDPGIRSKLWGGALGSPGGIAGSRGGAPIAGIRQDIGQQTPH